jgi:hypothetical protein
MTFSFSSCTDQQKTTIDAISPHGLKINQPPLWKAAVGLFLMIDID